MVVVQAAWRQALQPLAPPGRLASQHLRHRPSAYSSRSSNSGSGLPRQRDYADEETDGSESSSFQAFRDFQRQAARANVQQREPQQAGGQTSSGEYRTRRSWERLSKAWYTHPKYDINTLHEEVLRRCERLMCNSGPLFMMCKLARTPEDAALVLDAFAAVRINYASKGKLQRYKDELVALFVRVSSCWVRVPFSLFPPLQAPKTCTPKRTQSKGMTVAYVIPLPPSLFGLRDRRCAWRATRATCWSRRWSAPHTWASCCPRSWCTWP